MFDEINLLNQLRTEVDTVKARSAEEILFVSSAVRNSNTTSFFVNTAAELSSLTLPVGSMVFVREFNDHVVYNGTRWIGLDARGFNGVMWGWGINNGGQLGTGDTSSRSSPINTGANRFVQVASSTSHSIGLLDNGRILTWGNSSNGELGNNSTASRLSPGPIAGEGTSWNRVSTNGTHNLATTTSGVLWAWGANSAGELGDNTSSNRSSPVTVVGNITTWSQISAGNRFSLASTSAGVLWAWGHNIAGALGDNTTVSRSSPVSVVGGITTWSQISAGNYRSAAIASGVIWTWGRAQSGSLGDNTTVSKSSPVSVVGGITNWTSVVTAARSDYTLGIAGGVAWAWGYNAQGRLGDNTTVSKSSPVSVVGGITNWTQIAIGSSFTMGLTASGTLWGWGRNTYGQLGTNNTTSFSSPASVVGGITNWVFIAAGGSESSGGSTIALRA